MRGSRDKQGWDAWGVVGCSVGNHRKYTTAYASAGPIFNREDYKPGVGRGSD